MGHYESVNSTDGRSAHVEQVFQDEPGEPMPDPVLGSSSTSYDARTEDGQKDEIQHLQSQLASDSSEQQFELSATMNTVLSSSSPDTTQQRISWFDAVQHLCKGNLGPGCLNLPHAFGLSGWLLGTGLFAIVALQGIYSMILLAECKQILQNSGRSASTFMDVAHMSLGGRGQAVVQLFLFVLQTGVCCVFLSLIATNLNAQLPRASNNLCIGLVTLALLGVVWIRTLKNLRWLSTTANVFMFMAISTSAIAGLLEVSRLELPLPPKATDDLGNVATFISSMFFSFEGIGLVLPVENSFTISESAEETSTLNSFYRSRVLPVAMSIVGILFWIIGFFASWGFPDIENGSITAYLAERYPDQIWYTIVNTLVMIAVYFTFPLQLTPAMEVLDEWCRPTVGVRGQEGAVVGIDAAPMIHRVDSLNGHGQDALLQEQHPCVTSWWKKYEWIVPRYLVVFGCAAVVLLVDDLGLLMALFGAIGQTGLAMMPCLCHLALQREGLAPKARWKSFMDIVTVFFATLVMLLGLVVSVDRIVQAKQHY